MAKKKTIKTKVYKLTDTGKELISENEYTKSDLSTSKLEKLANKITKPVRDFEKITGENRKLDYWYNIAYPNNKIENEYTRLALETSSIAKGYLDLVSYPKTLKDSFLAYDNTVNEFLHSINVFENNPIIKHQKEVEQYFKEFKKSKKRVEKELYYQLTENELNDTKRENKALKKQLKKALKKITKDERVVDLAYTVTNNIKPKKANISKPQPLSLKPNFDDLQGQVEIIYNETHHLFTSSLEQWLNLFSNDIQVFKKPIELKKNTDIADTRLFLDTLNEKGLIKNKRFNKLLEDVKAFSYEGKVLNSDQYKNARQIKNYPYTKNYIKVNEIFTALNLDD